MKISSLYRIYIDNSITPSSMIELSKEHAHYLINVLRLKDGDKIRIFNENDGEYLTSICNASKKSCNVKVIELLRKPEEPHKLYLVQAIIKNDKMLQILDMVTQIGVTDIIPIISERVQNKKINYQRYRKCIIESTEQSERITPPTLREITSLDNFYQDILFDKILYANEMENSGNLLKREIIADSKNIAFVIGPEGGFTDREIESLSKIPNSYSISLGPNVLRAETAAIALAAQIQLLRD